MESEGAHDSMLYWLARTCKAARDAADRKPVHVAASANVDQSTITRFEKAVAWPRDTDRIVAAYAEDLEVPAIQLWRDALGLWAGDSLAPPEATEPLVQEHEKQSGRRRGGGQAASGS